MITDPAADRARHQRASEILLAACDLRGPARHEAIREACAGDAALLELVLGLDAHLDDSTEGLHTGAVQAAMASLAGHVASARDATPAFTRIGRYRIVAHLGAGGMGEVLEAEQDRPKRHVAVKVLRSGTTSREVIARFEREAQVLGQLQHPGIAQVYEAGIADTEPPVAGGVAFIAMELVRGLTLAEHARAAALSTKARLELLASACDAVHHAHVRGFVHRDLKPSNILVDERGQPKVLDFGVARASRSDLEVATLHTTVGQLIGTIPYMSPEQAGGDVTAVDARSDVYALGVVACELLTGRLPHDLRGLAIPDALRMIREEEPTRVGSVDSKLRGDVDTIVAKALEKDPERRYQSAAEMAADIRRHLANQPIHARPPSTTYQLAKFARRNKALVAGVLVAFVALALGAVLLDRARRREIVQRTAADANAQRADEERRAALEAAYHSSLTAGITSLEADNVRAALAHLDEAPESLRAWEWQHVSARLDDSTTHLAAAASCLITWSPDGRRVTATHLPAVGRSVVRVYDAVTGTLVKQCDVVANPDVTIDPACLPAAAVGLVFGRDDRSVTIRDPATAAPLLVLPRPPHVEGAFTLRQLSGAPDLLWFQVPSRIGWITWGSQHWTLAAPPLGAPDGTWRRAVDPARRRVLVDLADTGRAEIRDLASLRLVATLAQQPEPVTDVAWSRDGRRALTSGRDGTVRSWDAPNGRQVALARFEEPITAIDASDALVAIGSRSGLIRLLDGGTLAVRGVRRGAVGSVDHVAFSPDGTVLATTASADDVMRLWSPSLHDPRLVARHESYAYDVVAVPGTRMVVSCGWDGTLRWSDARTGELLGMRGHPAGDAPHWRSLALSPDGKSIAAAAATSHRLVVLDAATGDERHALPVEGNWSFAAWSLDGRRLATGHVGGLVVSWDVSSWTEASRWHAAAHPLPVVGRLEAIATSHDQSRLVASAGDRAGTIVILDADSLREIARSAPSEAGTLRAVAWSPDDALIVTGSGGGRLELLDARTAERGAVRLDLGAIVYDLAFSPDGTRLVAALEDGTLSVVSWPALREMARLRAHARYVHAASWLPDGSGVVTASGDGSVRSWTTWPLGEQLADRARAEPRRKELEPLVRAVRARSASWPDCAEKIREGADFAAGDDRALALQVAARLATLAHE